MKSIFFLFLFVLRLKAAVIIQDYNDQFGIRTTVELNDLIYSYQYELKLPSFVQGELSLLSQINELIYYVKPPETGSFTVKFDSFQAPVSGHLQGINWKINGWVPAVPEISFGLFPIAALILLTRRKKSVISRHGIRI